jgi:acetyl esterase
MLDPDWFRPDLVDTATASAYQLMRERMTGFTVPSDIAAARAAESSIRARLAPAGVIYESPGAINETIDGPGGPLPIRVLAREVPAGVLLYLHGGGWVFGGADLQDRTLERFADATGLAVVSVGYRLSPEHPYPAPLDDAEAAARWLINHAGERFGTERLAIGGSSSGANLALSTVLRLRADDLHGRFRALVLQSGAYDLSGTPSQSAANAGALSGGEAVQWSFDQYASSAQRRNPDVSPLWADLVGVPPTVVVAGSEDRLIDDTLFLYCRLLAAGVRSEIAIARGCDHNFDELGVPEADVVNAAVAAFVRRHVTDAVTADAGRAS